MRPQAWGYTFAPQGRPKARIAPPHLGAAQRPNWPMRPQAWGYTFAPQGRPKARIAPPHLGAAQRPNWPMRPQEWGSNEFCALRSGGTRRTARRIEPDA